MRRITDLERRHRLAVRHALTASAQAGSPEAATEAVVVLHATEPATVYLSLRARVSDLSVADVDRALHEDRTLVKQLAMRRTLFVFPRDLLPAAWGSASARVAELERRRTVKDVEKAGVASEGAAWLEAARIAVLAQVAEHPEGLTGVEVRERVPEFAVQVGVAGGAVWGPARVLTHLGASAEIVRAVNTGHWRTSRPRWATMESWLGEVPDPLPEAEGYAVLVARWLRSFGPGTETDLAWWLGATKTAVRRALADVEAVEVELEGDEHGWVLPDDLEPVADPGPWVALLPVLDPTVMGWKQRDFYLGGHAATLFDANGNAGTTAWVDGRIVGCWVQDAAGVVHLDLLDDVPARRRRELEAEAARLTRWLDGTRVGTVYPSPAMKDAREQVDRP